MNLHDINSVDDIPQAVDGGHSEQMNETALCQRYHMELNITYPVLANVLGHTLSKTTVCIVTQLNFSRMDRLKLLMKHWKGKWSCSL